MKNNFVAKNMHKYNKPKVEQSKRNELLQDALDRDTLDYLEDDDEEGSSLSRPCENS